MKIQTKEPRGQEKKRINVEETIRALKNAGIWEDVRSKYLDANGDPRANIIIPTWFLNNYKTWNGGEPTEENWNKWCSNKVNNTGVDPRKRKVGKPKLPQHLKRDRSEFCVTR